MKTVTALNGKEYQVVGMTKEYGEVLFNGKRYFHFSSGRMMPLSKAKVEEATFA
jgi:hypothetical protein